MINKYSGCCQPCQVKPVRKDWARFPCLPKCLEVTWSSHWPWKKKLSWRYLIKGLHKLAHTHLYEWVRSFQNDHKNVQSDETHNQQNRELQRCVRVRRVNRQIAICEIKGCAGELLFRFYCSVKSIITEDQATRHVSVKFMPKLLSDFSCTSSRMCWVWWKLTENFYIGLSYQILCSTFFFMVNATSTHYYTPYFQTLL